MAGLLTVLTLLVAPVATASPAHPVPQATTSPTASPTGTPTGTPTPSGTTSPTAAPRPDPEGERWIQLAVVGGGSLLGAVVMFMVIGGVIRAVNRRRDER